MVQFCYLRQFGIDSVSRRLLQWIARIEMDWNLGQQQDTYSNFSQLTTWLIQTMKVTKKLTLK